MRELSPEPSQSRPGRPDAERELRQEQRIRHRVRWVASPPPGSAALKPRENALKQADYSGPPRYAETPRWGFPKVAWRSPAEVSLASTGQSALHKLRTLTPFAITSLIVFALLALISSGGEVWRYLLLVRSRDSALSAAEVGFSDALVTIGSLLTFGFALLPIAVTARWVLVARTFLTIDRNQTPARSFRQTIAAFVVPVFNLFAAGGVLAELEHTAFDRSSSQRPRPSRSLLTWWGFWVINQVLLIVLLVLRWRGGLTAQTDGVLLTGFLDLSAAAVAIATAVLLRQWMRSIVPVGLDRLRFRRVLRVSGAPEPKLRPQRSAGAAR